jgi:hypothetical protein
MVSAATFAARRPTFKLLAPQVDQLFGSDISCSSFLSAIQQHEQPLRRGYCKDPELQSKGFFGSCQSNKL